MEFRHASWFSDDVYEALRSRDVALVAVDEDEEEGAGAPLVPTASWGYLRMRRGDYPEEMLTSWSKQIGAQSWTEAYVFVKHEEGTEAGPAAAAAMAGTLGYSTT